MTIGDLVGQLFVGKTRQLSWYRLDSAQIDRGYQETPIESDQHYFVVRLTEMYLRYTRQLWRKFYPMLHCHVQHGGREEDAVVGPGQLTDLGSVNLDRLLNLNQRLAGPTPYRGGDVTLLTGLYAVPGQDLAGMLVTNVSALASLSGVALGQATEIANLMKTSIEGLLGLSETALQLGVRDTFFGGNPLRAGYYVGLAAPSADRSQLWLSQGRLVKGANPRLAKPLEDFDYMVLEIEARDRREDWPRLPGLTEINEKFAAVMRDGALKPDEKEARLHDLWPEFTAALGESPFLTKRDAEFIGGDVATDLRKRLDALRTGNPFERRAWGDRTAEARPPTEFDFVDVADYVDRDNPADVERARAALTGNPFPAAP